MAQPTNRRKFRIKLKNAHDKSGLSPYKVWKKTGVAINTVVKYTEPDSVESDWLPTTVIVLAEFYGVDWRDPSVIEVIEEDEEDPDEKTPLDDAA